MGKSDQIGGGIFACLGVFIWVYTWHFPVLMEAGSRHPGPALFPRVLASLFIFFGFMVILNGWRAGSSKMPSRLPREEGAAGLKMDYFNPVLVVILIVAFIFFTPKLGFLITATAILAILMMKLQVRPLKSLIISVVLTCFVYFVFAKILRVPLPIGLLGW